MIAVLGDMLELGKEENKIHQDLLPHIISNNIEVIFLYGLRMKKLYEKAKKHSHISAKYFNKKSDLISALKQYIKKEDGFHEVDPRADEAARNG